MNKKLRIFLCSLFSVIAIFALAFAVGCDNVTVSSSSESTSVSDSGTENTGSEESSGSETSSSETSSSETSGSETSGSETSGSETTTPDYDLDNATWSWTANSDGSYSVTVTVTDKNGGADLTVTADNVTVTSAVKTAATCTSKGTTTYTATFTYGGKTYTATKDVEDIAIDPDNHAEELTLVEGVASTDDADGTIAYYYCSACKSMYADSTGKTALSATDIVIAHKASSVPTAISMPTAASTTATTSAVLNSSNSSFDLEYEVTVSGTYTITLVCEDLNDLSVSVYNSWYSSVAYSPVGTLQDAQGYTISYDYAAGETLEIYAYLSTTKLYPVTFSVEISYTEKSVTRPVEGYYEGGAIYIGSPYSYSADMTVTADDDSSNTLYYYTSGGTGVDLTLTVTSSDTTFTVYGYNKTDGETEYSVWTLDSNGSITFTVGARKNAYIKITCDSLTTSGAASGTISVSLAEAEKETTYLEEKTYSVSSYDTIELVAQTAGYYTFKVDENGEVKLTVEGSTETYTDNNGYTMTYDDGRYFGSDEGEYEVTVYIGENVNVSLYGYSASSVTVTYSSASGGESGGNEDTLTLDNAVKLTQGSDEYAEYTLTFTTAGTYMIMFTVDESSEMTVAYFAEKVCDASFTIGSTSYTYKDVVVSSDSSYCYIQFTVSESDLDTVTFKLGVVQTVTYSATVTAVKAEEGGEESGVTYQDITLGETLTLDVVGASEDKTTAYSYASYDEATAGSYTLTITYSYYMVEYYVNIAVTVNGSVVTGASGVYGLTLTDGTNTIVITYTGSSDSIDVTSYGYYITLTSGAPISTSTPDSILDKESYEISISAGDGRGGDGKEYKITAEQEGTYILSIDTKSDAYITVTVMDTNGNYTVDQQVLSGSDNESLTIYVAEGYTINVNYATYSYGAATYTLYVEKTTTVKVETSVPTLEVGKNSITLDSEDAYGYDKKAFTATAAGYYTFSVSSSANAYVYVGSNATVALGGYIYEYTFYLAANQVIPVEFQTNDQKADSYEFVIDYSATIPESTAVTLDTYELGDNVMVLDGSSYYYSYVNAYFTTEASETETSTEYTITISGDITSVTAYVFDSDTVTLNSTTTSTNVTLTSGSSLRIYIVSSNSASFDTVTLTIAEATSGGTEEGGTTTVTGVNATVNIGSLVSAETLSATSYSEETTLYSGEDGTAVSVTASSDSTVSVDSNKKSIDEYSFTYRLKLSGTGSADARSLKITTVGACTILVYMMSSSSSSTRTVNLYDSTYTQISGQSKTVQGVAISCYAFTVSAAGTYYIGSAKDGLNVYGLVIDYDCSTLSVAESVAVTGTATTLAAGETTTLTATVSMTEGTTYTGSYVWVTSDSDATSVSSSGVVTAKSVTEDTEVTITVSTNEGVIATYKITITADISAVSE